MNMYVILRRSHDNEPWRCLNNNDKWVTMEKDTMALLTTDPGACIQFMNNHYGTAVWTPEKGNDAVISDIAHGFQYYLCNVNSVRGKIKHD